MPSLSLRAQPGAQAPQLATRPAASRAAGAARVSPALRPRSPASPAAPPPSFRPSAVRADAPTEVVDATILNTISSVTAAAEAALASAAGASKAAAAAAAAAPPPTSTLKQRVLAAVESVQAGLLERETEVRTWGGERVWRRETEARPEGRGGEGCPMRFFFLGPRAVGTAGVPDP